MKYDTIICADLRAFDCTAEDFGVQKYIDHLGFVPDTICLLSFYAQFLGDFQGINDSYIDHLCVGQAGTPCEQEWSSRHLKCLVESFKKRQIKVVLGILSSTTSPVFKNTNYVWQYPEVLQTMRGEKLMWGNAINPLKRFADGTYFEDWFCEKLDCVLNAFSFDGFVAGDGMLGLRGPRETLKDTDFSLDMVEQFTQYAKLAPITISDYDARADYIVSNFFKQWVDFYVWRWGVYTEKISSVLKPAQRSFMAIDAWSRNPEEEITAFGIDYRLLCEKGLEGVFVQARETNKWRKHREGEYVREQNSIYTFLTHKAYEPRLHYYWAQATVNLPEFWNTVQDLPNVAERETYGYLWTKSVVDGHAENVCDGLCIIWGNDLTHDNWKWLKQHWDQAFSLGELYHKPIGPVLLWTELGVNMRTADNKQFGARFAALLDDGVSIQTSISEKEYEALCANKKEPFENSIYITMDKEVLNRHAELRAKTFLLTDDFIEYQGVRYGRAEGVSRIKKASEVETTKGRLMGFETQDDKYVLSVENAANLFYEHVWIAVSGDITNVEVLPPREWYSIPHSTQEGTTVIAVAPDASTQMIISKTQNKNTEKQFIKKDLGI